MAQKREGYHDLFAQVPVELWQALNDEADAEHRSATAQLIHILADRYKLKVKPAEPRGRPRKGK